MEPAAPTPRPLRTLLPAAIDFQSDARRIDDRRPPWLAGATLYTLVAVIFAALVWASLAKVDRIVVAPGKLVTTAQTIVAQPKAAKTNRRIKISSRHRQTRDRLLASLPSRHPIRFYDQIFKYHAPCPRRQQRYPKGHRSEAPS